MTRGSVDGSGTIPEPRLLCISVTGGLAGSGLWRPGPAEDRAAAIAVRGLALRGD
jgi:hypothetical protein